MKQTRYHVEQGPFRWTYRFFSGRPVDGIHRTNATYLHPATEILHPSGRASKWAQRPGWQRQLYRLGFTAAVPATGWAYLQEPEWTVRGAGAAGAAYTVRLAAKTRRKWKRRHHTRHYLKPTANVLGQLLKQDINAPDKWLHIPEQMTVSVDDGEGLADKIALPAWMRLPEWAYPAAARWRKLRQRWTGPRPPHEGWALFSSSLIVTQELKRTVKETLLAKLPHDDLRVSWYQQGQAPTVRWTLVPRPADFVGFDELRPHLAGASDAAPIMGLSAGSKPVAVDLDSESPHVAVSCAPGAGKSIWGRVQITQLLHHGAQVVVFDAKRVSQAWCKDLPGVTYCRTGEEIHNTVVELAAEMDRRYTLLDSTEAEREDELVDSFPRIVVFFEEQNIGMQRLRDYWQEIKQKGDPALSPGIKAYRFILQGGRQAKMHVISIAQYFTVQASGGDPSARENYSSRVLARASRQAWSMLAPEIGPQFPRQSKRRGRMHLIIGGEAIEFQTAFLTVEQAREYATAGAPVTVPAAWNTGADLRDGTQTVTLYPLPEIAKRKMVPLSYDALRQAKSRDESFPVPRARRGERDMYSPADIADWYEDREAKRAKEATETATETADHADSNVIPIRDRKAS